MRVLFLTIILALAGCAERVTPASPDPGTRLATANGSLVGYVAESGAHVWRAIPYAAPPVGDLRWRAPRPAESWIGERLAIFSPEFCPQLANSLSADLADADEGRLIGSEDCLYLDIYAPPNAANLPVMMWIHGGSNTWGWADQYDGSQLAMDQNVIIVVVQYRLGPLGFFSHPELRADAQNDRDEAANFAILDQIAALEWIQGNIDDFGGDADTVTIFGESAGGHNVAALLGSPLATGLFHRAIIQSGSASTISVGDAEGLSGNEVNGTLQTAERIATGDVTAASLRSASLNNVFSAFRVEDGVYSDSGGSIDVPTVIADGITIPEGGLMQAFSSPDTFNAVPVITGTNRDEVKLYNGLNPDLVARHLGLFFRVRDSDLFEAASEYQSRIWAINAVDEIANAMTAGGHPDVWAYRFDWDEGGNNIFLDSATVFGAMHSMEIPFVFNTFEFFGSRLDPIVFNDANADGRLALAAEMGGYWARFARQGDPGDSWTRWSEESGRLRFDTPASGGSAMLAGELTLEGLAADVSNDARLSAEERCAIVAAMQGRYFDDTNVLSSLTDC
ncbi:MAG: carboxylic ester hydrolase [Hyphobacterium sp.]|nr:MAG: carboxylic ester hydrolase [Hyphobacterium sp.]